MPVLRSIESKLEALFEGVFGRAFRTNVQPVELARKLVKEMDDHRNISVSRVYVPNEYTIYLAPADREQFSSYERQLQDELAEYLAGHARRENYALLTPPRVLLDTDEDLDIGVFGIATRMVEDAPRGEEAPPNATVVYAPAAVPAPVVTEAASPVELGIEEEEVALLRFGGGEHELAKPRVVLGRSRDADIQVSDPNVSRRHAEVRREGADFWLVDLDSTNGIEVRGKRVKRLKLEPGSRFTLGSTEIAFDRELR
jgi:hypothetical protein